MKNFKERTVFYEPGEEGGGVGAQVENIPAEPDYINNPFPQVDNAAAEAAAAQAAAEAAANQGSQSSQDVIDDYWAEMAERLSTDTAKYEIPEPIRTGKNGDAPLTRAEKFNFLLQTIHENTRVPELEDAFIKDYIANKRVNPDFDPVEWVDQYAKQAVDFTKMDDKTFLFEAYKMENGKSEENPNGWSDEDINTELNRLGRIEMTEKRKQKESLLTSKRNQQIEVLNQQKVIERKSAINKMQEATNLEIDRVSKQFAENKNINGLDLGESDLTDAINEFKVLSTYDDNGNRPLYDLFNDEANLFKAFLFVRKDGALMKEILSSIKSDAALDILKRTSLNPEKPGNQFAGNLKLPTAADFY